MPRTRRAIAACVTALAALAISLPAHTASAATHAATSDADITPSISIQPSLIGMQVALTDEQAFRLDSRWSTPRTSRCPLVGTSSPVLKPRGKARCARASIRTVRGYAFTVYFTKHETLQISAGYAACGLVVGRLPVIGSILAAYCGGVATYAGVLLGESRCLRSTFFWGSVAPSGARVVAGGAGEAPV